jgi:hypothetical protein
VQAKEGHVIIKGTENDEKQISRIPSLSLKRGDLLPCRQSGRLHAQKTCLDTT